MTPFSDLGLNPMILQALTEIGFETPTPIQSKVIPHLLNSNKDLVGLAQTGTGKTAAFVLPIIQQLDMNRDEVQSLILCPTRELAMQIAGDIKNFIKYLPGVTVTVVYGGERIDKQIRAFKNRPQIVVGTPGRTNDLIRRGVLKVNHVRWLVLDEADEMLNMGFKEELDEVLQTIPNSKQALLFSATMNQQIRRIADNYMKKPEDITVGEKNKGADNVQHFYYVVHEKDRYQVLRRIADANPDIHGLIFCRTRRETQQIADKLIQDHYSAEAIHGEISQEQRTLVMNRFRDKKIQLLVATDVAARGIDVAGLTHVINYNIPDKLEAYVHRSGRTGRANKSGISLVIVNMREKYKIRMLEAKVGKSFEQARIPGGEDICEKQLFNLVDKVCTMEVNETQINKYLGLITKKFEHMSREELIKRLISEEFNRFLDHYQNAADLNSGVGSGDDSQKEGPLRYDKSNVLFARFNINIGRSVGLHVKELLDFINSQRDLKGVEIGTIELNRDYTLFEIDERLKNKVLKSFEGIKINGIKIEIFCEETGIKSVRQSSPKNFKRRGGPPRHGGGGYGGRERYTGKRKRN